MSTADTPAVLQGFSARLVREGLLSEDQASNALSAAKNSGISLYSFLISNGIIEPRELVYHAAEEYAIHAADLDAYSLEKLPVKLVDPRLLRRYRVLPLHFHRHHLHIGISDPHDLKGLPEIAFQTGYTIEPVLVRPDKLRRAIDRALDRVDYSLQAISGGDEIDTLQLEGNLDELLPADATEDDAPVVRFVKKILLDAIHLDASDIHFEVYENNYRVRNRIDGVLHEVSIPAVSPSAGNRIASRIKVLARLDTSEKRMPQDGRTKIRLSSGRKIDFRVSTCPTLFGEKVVMRILESATAYHGIDFLGFEPDQEAIYLDVLSRPQGMILATGPTGSGKSVTLYTGLNILNTLERNLCTVEDPCEIYMAGANQVNVNPKVGLTFASAMRAFLRQDPDVIMVGEIRDLETADIAMKAAQTGHMVLSTLHTNDAPSTLTRMMNMNVAPYNIASSISLIIAQRLVRRLCPKCKIPDDIAPEILLQNGFTEEEIPELRIFKQQGCDQCTGGYKGRIGVYQIMPITEDISDLILRGGSAIDISRQARENGILSLYEAGLNKVRQGVTSLQEIIRVTKV